MIPPKVRKRARQVGLMLTITERKRDATLCPYLRYLHRTHRNVAELLLRHGHHLNVAELFPRCLSNVVVNADVQPVTDLTQVRTPVRRGPPIHNTFTKMLHEWISRVVTPLAYFATTSPHHASHRVRVSLLIVRGPELRPVPVEGNGAPGSFFTMRCNPWHRELKVVVQSYESVAVLPSCMLTRKEDEDEEAETDRCLRALWAMVVLPQSSRTITMIESEGKVSFSHFCTFTYVIPGPHGYTEYQNRVYSAYLSTHDDVLFGGSGGPVPARYCLSPLCYEVKVFDIARFELHHAGSQFACGAAPLGMELDDLKFEVLAVADLIVEALVRAYGVEVRRLLRDMLSNRRMHDGPFDESSHNVCLTARQGAVYALGFSLFEMLRVKVTADVNTHVREQLQENNSNEAWTWESSDTEVFGELSDDQLVLLLEESVGIDEVAMSRAAIAKERSFVSRWMTLLRRGITNGMKLSAVDCGF